MDAALLVRSKPGAHARMLSTQPVLARAFLVGTLTLTRENSVMMGTWSTETAAAALVSKKLAITATESARRPA